MVMVQLKEEPGYAGEAEEWSRLIVSEFVFSCPCLQEAFTDVLSHLVGPPLCQWSWSSVLSQNLTLSTPRLSVLEDTLDLAEVWHVEKPRPREREWHT